MRAGAIAAIASCALLSGCGEFLSFEAEAPNACVTIVGLHVPGADEIPVPYTQPTPKVTVSQSYEVPIDSTIIPTGSASHLSLVSFELSAQGGATFDFVDSAVLYAVDAGVDYALARYDKSGPASSTLEMHPSPSPEVTSYVTNGKLVMKGSLTGTAPAHSFTADAMVCFDVKANIVKAK